MRSHCLTYPVSHEPCAFKGNFQSAVQLIRAYTLLTGAHKSHCLQPFMQGNVAILKDSADLYSKRFPAGIAFVNAYASAFAFQFTDTFDAATMRAECTLRPHAAFDKIVSGLLVLKVSL